MNRVAVIVSCGLLLAGCGSVSLPGFGSSEPTPITLNLESDPAGAEVTLSTGGTCKTPCALPVEAALDVTATFTLENYLPRTLTATVVAAEKNFVGMESAAARFDPNPLRAELQPEPPKPKRPAPKRPQTAVKPATPPPPAAPAPASPAPATSGTPKPPPSSVAPAAPWPAPQ